MDEVNCGDVVRAYLAAAEASKMISDHVWQRRPYHYENLESGIFTFTDEVAHFISDHIVHCDKVPSQEYGS